jgi:streptogramin lyase
LPVKWYGPYREALDRNGDLWAGTENADRVIRIDTKTGQEIEYLMPKETNMRNVFVDNSTTAVTVWIGSNHDHALVKVEPLD